MPRLAGYHAYAPAQLGTRLQRGGGNLTTRAAPHPSPNSMRVRGYVVSLPHRVDRQIEVNNTLRRFWPQLDWRFFWAVDAVANQVSGRYACRLSHTLAIKEFAHLPSSLRMRYDAVAVFEDDVVFTRGVVLTLPPRAFDMLFLSYRPRLVAPIAGSTDWYRALDGWSMAAYMLNRIFVTAYLTMRQRALQGEKSGRFGHTMGFEHVSALGACRAANWMHQARVLVPRRLFGYPASYAAGSDITNKSRRNQTQLALTYKRPLSNASQQHNEWRDEWREHTKSMGIRVMHQPLRVGNVGPVCV